MLKELPAGADRDEIELSYLISLGPALMATAGWDADEVDLTYTRARELARTTGQSAALFPALWGLWLVAHASGDVANANLLMNELLNISRDEADTEIELQAHHAGASEMFTEGDFRESQRHVAAVLKRYDSGIHAGQALRYGGHDPGVCMQSVGALNLLITGDPAEAEQYSKAALELAGHVKHRPSVAHADLYRAELCHLLGRSAEVEKHATSALEIAEKYGIAHYAAWSLMLIGWSRCVLGDADEGIKLLDRGLDDLTKVGIRYHIPHRLALRVEALIAIDEVDESIRAAEECLASVHETGERWFEPEALRLVAMAGIRKPGGDLGEAYDFTIRAIRVADELKAPFWSLRSAVFGLSQLPKAGNDFDHRELERICKAFVDGADLPELRKANALIGRNQAEQN